MIANLFRTALPTLVRLCPVAAVCLWAAPAHAQNLITNGTFDTAADPWWSYAAADTDPLTDIAIAATTDTQLCATMTSGGKNPWDAIVGYSGLSLMPNQYYHIKFSAYADVARTIKFKVGLGAAPYTDYFIKTVSIGTAATPIEYTYLNLRTDAMAQFQFQIGSLPGKVCFDDIIVEPVAAPTVPPYVSPSTTGHTFKDYAGVVKMGTAVDTPMFLSNPTHNAIVAGEFSMITPANSMKMNLIQPTQGVFDFVDTDALRAWAQNNGLEFRGHPLIWHTQAPSWLNDGTFDRQQMIDIMYAHMDGLMGRYTDLPYWDVVNEAIDVKDNVWGFRSTVWHDRIGDDFMDLAFTHARAVDPDTKLFYNDYNIEQMGNAKADKVFQVISDMKARGIPIDGVGLQGHYFVEPNGNTASGVPDMKKIADNMARYAAIGVEVQITECDFRIGKPLDDTKTQLQNEFFAGLLQVCIDAPNCSHFTVWGLSDQDSWVPSTFKDYDYAHIFDTNLVAKPAYHAMTQVFAQYNTDGTPIKAANEDSGEEESSGGCSLSVGPNGSGSWIASVLALLGLTLLTRRSSKSARS